jgi:hypothetical protein
MRLPALFLFFPVVLAVSTLSAQTQGTVIVTAPGPSLTDIVQRAVDNDELRRQHRLPLECDQIITTERLDETGTVFKKKTARVVYHERSGIVYSNDANIPSGSNGRQDGDTVKAEHRMGEMNLRKLAPRFQYAFEPDSVVRGRACYVIDYSPRPGQEAQTSEEKVINHLHGRYWIDKKTYEILQGEGSLPAPVTVGVFAAVTLMKYEFHTQTLRNGEAGPAEFSVDFAVKAPFYFYRQQQRNQFENWRPAHL